MKDRRAVPAGGSGSDSDSDSGPGLGGTLFVLGKGGVGKTVIAAGLAALAVERGRRTLLVRIGETLESKDTKLRPQARAKSGLEQVDLVAREAMDEYIQKVVRVRPLVERITRSEIYRKFFAAAPGLPELVLLGRIRAFSLDTDGHGRPRFETIIVDCPSSGHGLLMMETPFAAFRAVPVGPFARLAAEIIEWLKTSARIALVAIPEEMAVVEAIEFKDDLLEKTGLSPALAFMNRMRRANLSRASRLALNREDVGNAADNPEGNGAAAAARSNDRLLLTGAREVLRRSRLESFHQRRLTRGLGFTPLVVGELPDCRPKTVAHALSAVSS